MARPLRLQFPGAFYHLTARGNARHRIYWDDADRYQFLENLGKITRRFRWRVHAYCLMDNHYHLFVETPDGNLAAGMRELNGGYTQYVNRRHRRVGHLLQGRYGSRLVQEDAYGKEVCRYIVMNPVRARMVPHPRDWRWSSYRPTLGSQTPPPCLTTTWLLGQWGRSRAEARRQFRAFVQEGMGGRAPWEDTASAHLVGEDGWVKRLREHVADPDTLEEVPKSERYVGRPSLANLLPKTLGGNRLARNRAIGDAVWRWGYTEKAVADHLGVHYSTVSRAVKLEDARFKT